MSRISGKRRGNFRHKLWFVLRLQAVRKCLLDRVPDEQKETNVQ